MKIKFIASYGTQTTSFNITDRGDNMKISALIAPIGRQWGSDLDGTEVRVNGSLVSGDYVVSDGDRVEFVRPSGSKG